ncbi:MAG: histidine phosphatase family protein [Caldilineaceae bacterium]|nr:histidine phosphatase family protein [Caldilineaceae bacterium]
MTQLWLVRHGQTDWNLQGRYQGQADPPLNENGVRQAQAVAEQLAGHHFEAIYSSDLRRAYDTALAIASRLEMEVTVVPGLREVNQGAWEGMLSVDIQAQYPDVWAWRERDPLHARPPGGESLHEVAQRVWAAVDEIVAQAAGGPLLIVSHGLALATLICRANQYPLIEAFNKIPDNARPHIIDWQVPEFVRRE